MTNRLIFESQFKMSCCKCPRKIEVTIDLQGDTDNVYHYCQQCFLKKYETYCPECNQREYDGKREVPNFIYGLSESKNCATKERYVIGKKI